MWYELMVPDWMWGRGAMRGDRAGEENYTQYLGLAPVTRQHRSVTYMDHELVLLEYDKY